MGGVDHVWAEERPCLFISELHSFCFPLYVSTGDCDSTQIALESGFVELRSVNAGGTPSHLPACLPPALHPLDISGEAVWLG